MKTPAEIDFDNRIKNLDLESRLLLFHSETLQFKSDELLQKEKVSASIVVIATINAVMDDETVGFPEVIEKKDIPRREEFYLAKDEFLMIMRRYNTLINELVAVKEHAGRIKNQDAMGIEDRALAQLVMKAKMVGPNLKGKRKDEMKQLVDLYEKGLTTMKQKISFVQGLKYLLLLAGQG